MTFSDEIMTSHKSDHYKPNIFIFLTPLYSTVKSTNLFYISVVRNILPLFILEDFDTL